MRLSQLVHPTQLGGAAERIEILHWEDDEFVIVVDGVVCGQTLHRPEAISFATWLSTALGSIKPLQSRS